MILGAVEALYKVQAHLDLESLRNLFRVYLGIFLKCLRLLTTCKQGQICLIVQVCHFFLEIFLCNWLTECSIPTKSTGK